MLIAWITASDTSTPLWIEVAADLAGILRPVSVLWRRQLYDYPMVHQPLVKPVRGDEGQQPMPDPVPLAGAWRQVGSRDPQPRLVGETLEFALP